MSETWIALAVLPLVCFMVVVVECSRLHCTRLVQRRLGTQVRKEREEDETALF